jgi:hypothetical protein
VDICFNKVRALGIITCLPKEPCSMCFCTEVEDARAP